MNIVEWLEAYGMPRANIPAAIQALAAAYVHTGPAEDGMLESEVQKRVRLEGAKLGVHLWRNNVGAGKLADGGRFIRFGLANDSPALNKVVKSGDLIGGRPILVTPDMVGTTVLRFTSREIKRAGWKFSGTLEECAQLQWCNLINSLGGDAKIVSGPGSFG
jgi:hypothetical protein